MRSRSAGLIAAPYTPFNSDGSLAVEVVPHYARFLKENGIGAAFVGGTTGEFASLTTPERLRLTEAWTSAAGKLRVIVHVGHTALPDAQALAEHAQRSGAAAIACMAPGFFRPQSVTSLVDWCVRVTEAAPRLPFYYYHMPSMNGFAFTVAPFVSEAARRIPTFAGIKFSHEDLSDFAECVRLADDRLEMLMGRDELLIDGLRRGATGAVGSTYNYAAPLYQRLMDALATGDAAKAAQLQQVAIEMIAICSGTGVTHLAASKTLMAMLGVDCGPVRMPLERPTPAQVVQLHATLQTAGFSDFACQPLRVAA